jgi:HPt (histidine-containing phosphotransfer) domain-containing protein
MSAEHIQLLSDYNKTLEDLFEARQKIKELEKEIERLKSEKVEDNPDYTYLRIY